MKYIGKVYGKFGNKYIEIDITEDVKKQLTTSELNTQFESNFTNKDKVQKDNRGAYFEESTAEKWNSYVDCAIANKLIKELS